jgi:CheY-like chemotaxis protein
MDRIVEEVIGLLQHTVEKNIRIVSERMPGVAGIDADPAQINQVVMNLAVNAVEAMKDGGTLTFRTRILSETDRVPANEWPEISGNCIMLEVCDTGCGIPDEARHRVFDPFFTTKQDGELKGTGLGLSTAYGIVHSYGGFIRFHSRKGQGTVFQALFPCGALAAGVEGGKSQAHVPPARSVSRILVIDDEEILRRMLREMLESLGYEILDAADGYEGIEMIEKNPGGIHLVILDVKMPRISGSDAFRLIRKADPEIKVLLTTGYGRSQDVQALLDLGANGVIEKPFSLATLGKTVGKLLEDVRR